MTAEYSIRQADKVFWKVGYSRDEIEAMVASGKVTGDWLVCIRGEAENAVRVEDFLASPEFGSGSVLKRVERSQESSSEEESELSLGGIGWLCLTVGTLFRFLLCLLPDVYSRFEMAVLATSGELALLAMGAGAVLIVAGIVKQRVSEDQSTENQADSSQE